MNQQQTTTLWSEARRLLGFIRSLFARLFPITRETPLRPTPPTAASPAAPQERTAFVTSSQPLQPTPPSVNGQPHSSPAPSENEFLVGEVAPIEETAEVASDAMDGDESEPVEVPPVEAEKEAELPLLSTLESLLFVADEPVEPARLAQALRRPVAEVNAALARLRAEYASHNRGVRLQERNGKVQLVTNPAAAQAVEDFLSLDLTTRLSGPALETLAIVAYRQPVTRVQIEAVRGVDCSGMIRKLEQHGLVEEVGRMETPGRPILYGVTDRFLQHFGLTRLDELPALPELDADSLRAVVALAEE